jgi:vitamin B12 transporter
VIRWEDYEAYGEEVTWRAAAAWTHPTLGTTVRGGVGRAFRSPTYLDLYGTNFGAGNPNLDAEDGIGWDLGVEQQLGNTRASLTWFESNVDNRIRPTMTIPVNLPGNTPTRGLEAASESTWDDGAWTLRVSWTWLDEALDDLPKHTANASLVWSPDPRYSVGIGATYVDSRSWSSFGQNLDDYFLVRLHGRCRINDHLELHARIENLLDEDYALFHDQPGFFNPNPQPVPGQGMGIFGGVTIDW